MPSIHSRRRNWYQIRWYEGGKRRASPVVRSRADAEAMSRAIEARLAAQKSIGCRDGLPLPLAEVVHRWKTDRINNGRSKEYADEAAGLVLRVAEEYRWTRTSHVTPAAIDAWRRDKKGRITRTFSYLRAVLRWARDRLGQEVHQAALVETAKSPRRRPSADLLTDDQMTALEAEAAKQSPSCVALLRFLATYGHRPITAARLTVADLDLERGTLTLNVKGGDTIRHAVLPSTMDDLRPLIEGQRPTCPIFRTVTGLPYLDPRATRTRQRMPAWFRDLAARAGVKASIYDLKRLAVSRLFAAGADLATIASITGHRTPAVLLRYARTNEARQQAALQHIARQQTDARRTHDGPPQA
jgi:site-specific recombinase XerD